MSLSAATPVQQEEEDASAAVSTSALSDSTVGPSDSWRKAPGRYSVSSPTEQSCKSGDTSGAAVATATAATTAAAAQQTETRPFHHTVRTLAATAAAAAAAAQQTEAQQSDDGRTPVGQLSSQSSREALPAAERHRQSDSSQTEKWPAAGFNDTTSSAAVRQLSDSTRTQQKRSAVPH